MKQCTVTIHRLPSLEQWTGDQFLDWLHPCHGPLPTILAQVDVEDDHYALAVWIYQDRIVTALECPEKPAGRGSILWSANWAMTRKTGRVVPRGRGEHLIAVAEAFRVESPENYPDSLSFMEAFAPMVLMESRTAPLGTVHQGTTHLDRIELNCVIDQ